MLVVNINIVNFRMSDWLAAVSGFTGVIVGSGMSWLQATHSQRKSIKAEQVYLAIKISFILDRFVDTCVEVVRDDGTYRGRTDQNGYLSAQVSTPSFDPLTLDVNWKSLPGTLMYELWQLSSKIEDADHYIGYASENANPPDFEEYFEARIEKYSELGLEAIRLTEKLRLLAELPAKSMSTWSPKEILTEEQSKLLERQKVQAAAHAKSMSDLMASSKAAPFSEGS